MALLNTFPLDQLTYGFEWIRYTLGVVGVHEGVVDGSDFKVAHAGTGLRVDVNPGTAVVRGDTGVRNGLYVQVNDAYIGNAVTLATADATNPRVDQVYLQVNDVADLASAGNAPALAAVTGTPTAGATLDNRTGAGAVPANSLLLADVLVPAGATGLNVNLIRDRRRWARGGYNFHPASSDLTTVTTTPTGIPGLSATFEVSDGQRAIVTGYAAITPSSSQTIKMHMNDNGSRSLRTVTSGVAGVITNRWEIIEVGRHTVTLEASGSSATSGTVAAGGSVMTVALDNRPAVTNA